MKNLTLALTWKYGNVFSAKREPGGVEEITWWNHATLPKPSTSEFPALIAEYESSLVTEKEARKNRKKGVLAKLKLDVSDLKALAELLQDRTDE